MNTAGRTLLLLSLVLPSTGLSSPAVCGVPMISGRIVGGEDAADGEWPWQVAVYYSGLFICGGSLITEQWVLSAAHCFRYEPFYYNISLGMHQLGVSNHHNVSAAVEQIIIHPLYISTGYRGDIALVKLANPVTFTNYILPICLPFESVTFPSGLECWVTGWGTRSSGESLPTNNTLQEVMTPLIDHVQCNQMYNEGYSNDPSSTTIVAEEICSGYAEGGKDSCQGDSGGPLVCEVDGAWIQAGIVSWGAGCAWSGFPGVYTLVPVYEFWIRSYIPDLTFTDVSIPPPPSTVPPPISLTPSKPPSPSVCGSPMIPSRIVGGTDAVDGEWPWQVLIWRFWTHACGGSLISSQWVLSSAHCFQDDPYPYNYYVMLGMYTLSGSNPNSQFAGVEEIIINSQYTSMTSRGNIALLKLYNPVAYNMYTMPICLPAASVTFPCGMECWVTGWGNIAFGVDLPYPEVLQKVKLPLIDDKRCDQMYHIDSSTSSYTTIIKGDMICAGYKEGGKDTCKGDAGGPLVCKVNGMWIQAGIVSWGEGCALAYRPGVYTLVSVYQSWIRSYIPELEFINIANIPGPYPPCDSVNPIPPLSDGGLSFLSVSWKIILFCLLMLCQS